MNDYFGYAPMPASKPLVMRDYQVRGVEMIDAARANGAKAPLLVAPTGSGKTSWATYLMRREIEANGRPLFLAPRRELVHQASTRLRESGVPHGTILAGEEHRENFDAPAQVCSIDTLLARVMRGRRRLELPDFSLVIIDEAHLAITERRNDLLTTFGDAQRLGLTATPIRKDGRALGMMFDALVEPTSVKELTEAGYLVKARYFSLSEPDLRRVKVTAGDYNAKQLDETMNTSKLVGDVVQHWLEHAASRRTVVFCTSIAHSVAVANRFLRAGVIAEHVDAGTPTSEREDIFARFSRGDTQILTNCFLASYGFDLPALSCVVLARPTKSEMLYLQMIGRGLRPADGKADCLVLDHAGCVHTHGFADDDRHWSLDGRKSFARGDTTDDGDRVQKETAQIDCPECHAVFSRTNVCPECGYTLKPAAKDVEANEGKLVEINARSEVLGDPKFYQELLGYARDANYNPAWAAHKYKEKFGAFPPWAWKRLSPMPPSLETGRWVKSRQIAWIKAQQQQRKNA